MTRFLNVSAFLNPESGGGTAERTYQLSRALADQGVDTTVLCLDIGVTAERRAGLRGARVVAIPCVQKRFLVPELRWSVIRQTVQDADVIQLTNHWTALNAIVYAMARHMRKPWIVCPAGALNIFGRSRRAKHFYNRLVGRRIVQAATARVAITAAERSQFAPYGIAAEDVLVVPNGVTIQDFVSYDADAFRRRCGIAAEPFVLFMGRLSSSFKHHLVFAGPDEGMQRQLDRKAREAGVLGRVHFPGYLTSFDKVSAYHAADLIVVPSRQEAMSLVALEAGACRKPVILTDQCGFDEVQSVGGGLVVPVDSEAMAAAMLRMLGNQNERVESGERLYELVRRRYTWTEAARRYIEIFDSVRNRTSCVF
jgi:glycosyltransferase involved in cell wall biosynthesis